MRSVWTVLTQAFLLWALVTIPALASTAAAQTCSAGCGLQKRACLQTARTVKLSCKLDCRSNTDPSADLGTCMQGCVATFRDTKDTCRSDHQTCIGTCVPSGPPSPDGCLTTCGTDLAACARGVVEDGRTCLAGCRTAPDRLACLANCAATAQDGAATCATNFQTCVTGCGGSPSGAFL